MTAALALVKATATNTTTTPTLTTEGSGTVRTGNFHSSPSTGGGRAIAGSAVKGVPNRAKMTGGGGYTELGGSARRGSYVYLKYYIMLPMSLVIIYCGLNCFCNQLLIWLFCLHVFNTVHYLYVVIFNRWKLCNLYTSPKPFACLCSFVE